MHDSYSKCSKAHVIIHMSLTSHVCVGITCIIISFII